MELIKIVDFYKSFGIKKILNGVSISVNKGECVGLLGGSGTGKSVLLRSLIGLERPDKGQIFFDKQNICALKERNLVTVRKRIGYAFQGGALFDSMTVHDNLAYPLLEHTQLSKSQISKIISDKLTLFGLAGCEKIFPGSLSGGMQKRVGLARAIINDPEVILYDEPTAGLDPSNTRIISDMILKLKKTGVTSILVTHDMDVAFKVCDRIAILIGGVIKTIGNIKEIETQEGNIIAKFASGELF